MDKKLKVKEFLKKYGATIGLVTIGSIAAYRVGVCIGESKTWDEVIYMVEEHGNVGLNLRNPITGKVTSINMSLNG
ncbi:MAG: hypothetical protein LIP15_12570 [Clostridium sp.]|nr:hypothetical protein [Clostridium sp.]